MLFLEFGVQGQCKPNAIEFTRIAEVQPVLAKFFAKLQCVFHIATKKIGHFLFYQKMPDPIAGDPFRYKSDPLKVFLLL